MYLKVIWRNLRFWWQRRWRGWDDSETWNLDQSLSQLILPRLLKLRQLKGGYPGNCVSWEEWQEKLDEIIFAFRFYADGKHYELPDREIERARNGLELFVEHFEDLWW